MVWRISCASGKHRPYDKVTGLWEEVLAHVGVAQLHATASHCQSLLGVFPQLTMCDSQTVPIQQFPNSQRYISSAHTQLTCHTTQRIKMT